MLLKKGKNKEVKKDKSYSIQEYKELVKEIKENRIKKIRKSFTSLILIISLATVSYLVVQLFETLRKHQFMKNYKKASQFLDIKTSDIIHFENYFQAFSVKTKACTFLVRNKERSYKQLTITSINNLKKCANFAKKKFYILYPLEEKDIAKALYGKKDQVEVKEELIKPIEEITGLKFKGLECLTNRCGLIFKIDNPSNNNPNVYFPPCEFPLKIEYIGVSKEGFEEKIDMNCIRRNENSEDLCREILKNIQEEKLQGNRTFIIKRKFSFKNEKK